MSDLSRDKITDRATLEDLTGKLDGWTLEGDAIKRTWEFADFDAAIDFITKIAPHANELDHHPELFNVYNRVEVTLNTHDAGGLTEYDFKLAERFDSVAGEF